MDIILFFIYLLRLSNKRSLCEKCKFFKRDLFGGYYFGECYMFPKNISYREYEYCMITRNNNNMCGKDGKLFQLDSKNE